MTNQGLTLRGTLALAVAASLGLALLPGVAHAGGATPMPASLMFPMTGTGAQSKSMSMQFVNTSNMQITIDSVTVGGANPMDFVIVNPPNLPTGLVPNASLAVEVAFAPTNGGPRSAQLQAQVRGEMQTTNCALGGTGIGPKITVAPSPITMGGLLFGQMVPPSAITVSNQGGANVTVNKITVQGADAARFAISGLPNLPATLTPNQSFMFNLTFTPAQAGTAMTALVVESTDPMTPVLNTMVTGYSGNPKISVDLGTVIFGNQRVGQASGPQDLTITNTGLSDLKVTAIKLAGTNPGDFSLGGLPQFPVTLKIGQQQKYNVTFLPTQAGPRAANVQISSDDPNTPTRNVTLQGVGTTPGAMVSPAMIDFGSVKVAATGNASVSIQNSGTGPVLVNGLTFAGADAASFTSSLAAPFSVAAGATTIVQVSFKPKKVASFTAALNLTTDDPKVPMASVMLKGTSTSPTFSVSPMSIAFGGVVVGQTSPAQTFTIRNTGNQEMRVNTFALSGPRAVSFALMPQMKPPFTVGIGQSAAFMVTYKAGQPGVENAQVNIGVDDPLNPSATVSLSGRGQQANVQSAPVDMSDIDFDKVAVGSTSKPTTVKITNSGDAPLEIKSVTIDGMDGGFAVDDPGPFTVDPGDNKLLNITFTPLKGMVYMAQLAVTPADPLQPLHFNLLGIGSVPTLTATNAVGMSAIDFGQVQVDLPSKAEVVLIHNNDPNNAQSITIKTSDPQFTLDTTAAQVQAGATIKVNVRFTPAMAGKVMGKVTVQVPGITNPVSSVVLTGEGVTEGGGGDGGTGGDSGSGCAVGGHRGAGVPAVFGLLALLGLVLRRRSGSR